MALFSTTLCIYCSVNNLTRFFLQTLDICHLNHESDQVVTFHGRWEVGLNAGGVQKGEFKNFAKNPQCFIRLADPDPNDPEGKCSAIISLMQRREPKSRAKGMNKVTNYTKYMSCVLSELELRRLKV